MAEILTHDQLVDAKWGLITVRHDDLVKTALYWYDEARTLQIMLDAAREEARTAGLLERASVVQERLRRYF